MAVTALHRGWCRLLLLFTWAAVARAKGAASASLDRSSFPPGFIFGSSSSAYQVEGAASEGGKGPSIWDTFSNNHPDRIKDGSNGNRAIDSYNRYKEDVKMMKEMGLDAYRFSISWTRILPDGRGKVNAEGITYYKNLINEIISNGMQPFATLFHWDSPQTLEDEYGGFLNLNIVSDFRDYAEVCFREFGDQVKHWITLNEPESFCAGGYAFGVLAPGRCSPWEYKKCADGNSATEAYIVAHHLLLVHAAAVELYRNVYQAQQKGIIGVILNSKWFLAFSPESESDQEAATRALDFMYGWFMDPLTNGNYPYSMRVLIGDRLPEMTEEQSEMIKGSFDFIGINYYTANYATRLPFSGNINLHISYYTDSFTSVTAERNGIPIGPRAASEWLYVYPQGIRDLLIYTKNRYNNPVIYITENGVDEFCNNTLPLEEALKDDMRIDFYREHLLYVQQAIREGVDVRGYFVWSMFDDYEWFEGYTTRFGITYVDHGDGLKRHPKSSFYWFQSLLKRDEGINMKTAMSSRRYGV